ncbi:MAG TPA: GNAT family protein [Polyangiaceae bacterium]|jgi:ribosomal-protein-alanine N-acetyltransferase|nr:GNAT family protein [Polyangiaceae bacterium]
MAMRVKAMMTPRLCLEIPKRSDAPALLAYALRNQAFQAPFSPPPPPLWDTLSNARRRQRQYQEQLRDGTAYRFWFRMLSDPMGPLIGAASLTNIVLGVRRACSLGYHLDWEHQGRGLMHEALKPIIRFAFDELQLNRIEASYLPENARSARVLQRLGFQIEGLGRRYTFINGEFRDHVLTALLNDQLGNATELCTPKL